MVSQDGLASWWLTLRAARLAVDALALHSISAGSQKTGRTSEEQLREKVNSPLERLMRAASCVLFTSNRRGCCSECRCMSPFASPMERSRTPGNTETAIFDLEVETGRWRSHQTTHCSLLEAARAPTA